MLLFFVRHGDPTYDPDQLTPLGHRQAEAIGRRLARYGLDEIYVSSSTRAIETCMPTCELLRKKPTVLDWTNEHHAWCQEKLKDKNGDDTWCFALPEVKQVFTSKEMRELGSRWLTHRFFDEHPVIREGYLRVLGETREFLSRQGWFYDEERGMYRNLTAENPLDHEKRVALFAHHGFGTNFLSAVLDIPWPTVSVKMNFGHTGMTVIRFDDRADFTVPQMLTMANDGHLLADNMPTSYNNQIYF